MESQGPSAAFAIMAITATLGSYFLPWIIALARKHQNSTSIFALTLLLGWTVLGWIAALIWSFSSNTRDSGAVQVTIQNEPRLDRQAAQADQAVRTCPYCAETILAAAKKCKHCGSDLTAKES